MVLTTYGIGVTGCAGSGTADISADIGPQKGVIYYLDDHLGNTHLITDSQGTVLHEVNRYPYGLEKPSESSSDAVVDLDYVYTGKEYDEETGLIYFGGRYYSPEMGRWITADPLFVDSPDTALKKPLESNFYSFVRDNPVSFSDPTGYGAVAQVDAFDITYGVPDSWYPYGGAAVDIPVRGINTATNVVGYAFHGIDKALGVAGTNLKEVGIGLMMVPGAGSAISGFFRYMSAWVGSRLAGASGFAMKSGDIALGQGTKVFRVWGDEATACGRSWTTVDPRTIQDYRNVAGLPNQNSGRFLSEGILQDTKGVWLKSADPLHGNVGGLPEVIVPNPTNQIELQNIQGLNPEF